MSARIRLPALLLAALFALAHPVWAQGDANPDPQLAKILQKVERLNKKKSSDSKWKQLNALLGEACVLAHAPSCLTRASIGHLIAADQYPENAKIADLERACALGDAVVCTGAASQLIHRDGQASTAQAMYADACQAGNAYACNQLALALQRGQYLDLDLAAAKRYFRTACELGRTGACRDADAIPDAGEQLEMARIRSGRLRAAAANKRPDPSELENLRRKVEKSTSGDEAYEHLKAACDLGYAEFCRDAYQRRQDSALLVRACELEPYFCAQSGSKLLGAWRPDAAFEVLKHGCDVQFDLQACLGLADLYEGAPAVAHKPDMQAYVDLAQAHHYFQLACYVEKMDSTTPKCEKLQAFQTRNSPAALAAQEAVALRARLHERAVPLGAYSQCIDQESRRFGEWLDRNATASAEQAGQAYRKFMQQCGGGYALPHVEAPCAAQASRPVHHNLVCAAASRDPSLAYRHASSWTLGASDLEQDFRMYVAVSDVSAFANNDHLLPPPANALEPASDRILGSVTQTDNELLFIDYTDDGLVITVNRPGHAFTFSGFAKFHPVAGLMYLRDTAPDPNEAGIQDSDNVSGSVPDLDRIRHLARWDAERQRWQSQTQLVFALNAAYAPRLLTDLRLWFRVDEGDTARYFKLDPGVLQRWVLSRYVFWDQGRVPDGAVADAMLQAYRRAQAEIAHDCGEYKHGWSGDPSETFSKAQQRIDNQARLLQCRQQQLGVVQGKLRANSGALPPGNPEYWYQALLIRYISAEEPMLASYVEQLEDFRRTIAGEMRAAELAERRAEWQRQQEERANRPDKAAEFFAREAQRGAERDRENALRAAQGYPPLPAADSGRRTSGGASSRASSSSRKSSASAGGSGGSGAVLCVSHEDPDQDTCMSAEERAERKAAIERDRSRQRLNDWFAREVANCNAENGIGVRCIINGHQPVMLADAQQGLSGYQARSTLQPASGDCPPAEDRGNEILYWKAVAEAPDQPYCTVQQDGEMGLIVCRGRQIWRCEADIRKKLNGER